jgi:hypothetical protein
MQKRMNKEFLKDCIPMEYRIAGRSIKTQIDSVMNKFQGFDKIGKFELVNSEMLDENERFTSQMRNG